MLDLLGKSVDQNGLNSGFHNPKELYYFFQVICFNIPNVHLHLLQC